MSTSATSSTTPSPCLGCRLRAARAAAAKAGMFSNLRLRPYGRTGAVAAIKNRTASRSHTNSRRWNCLKVLAAGNFKSTSSYLPGKGRREEKSVDVGFKAAASEPGSEGGPRTRTAAESANAKSGRSRTQPYALETCLPRTPGASFPCSKWRRATSPACSPRRRLFCIRHYFYFLLGCQAARVWLARVGRPLSGVFSCLSVDGPRLWPFLRSAFLR